VRIGGKDVEGHLRRLRAPRWSPSSCPTAIPPRRWPSTS
jgi:hypothetical protein